MLLYMFWSKFLLVELIPYVFLIVLNCLIWRRVKTLIRMRKECRIEQGEDPDANFIGIVSRNTTGGGNTCLPKHMSAKTDLQ